VSVGSLKVKVINNVFFCPAEGCDKQFRKENHLQLHIKHYHGDLAKLMGECPNMEDLAYLRTTGTIEEAEVSIVKNPPRKSQPVKSTPTSSTPRPSKDLSESINSEASPSSRFNLQRSPILEEALKAPLVTCQPIKDFVIKLEPLSQAALAQFDPETLIPPHAVSRIQHQHHPAKGHHKRRIKLRFNPKSKKPFKKKIIHNVGSTVEGVIPYNEGPYLKNQVPPGNYVDENGEVIKIVRMKKEEIINCICGFGEEDGLMIQCDICLCWQHGWCHGIENSHQVPEKYICTICKNPYRQRASMRWTHDQDWLYDGKLPIASYHAPNPRQLKRVDTLKNCHTLIGNLMEMKKFMKSLDVKINIAENSEHPKLYLWSKKWEESPPRDVEMKDESKIKKEDLIMQPIAPEPEAAIEPAKCRQSLLDHIQNQQHCVKSRLDNIEMEIECKFNIKHLEKCKINHKFFLQPSKSKQLRTATPNSQSMKEL
jgi:PHD finger protein 20